MSFALFLFTLLAVTGFVWLLEIAIFRKRRAADARHGRRNKRAVNRYLVMVIRSN